MRHRVELIVPIKDRRRRRRVVTLRNVGLVGLVLLVALAAVSLRSEMRGRQPRNFGRVVGGAIPDVRSAPVEIVTEAPSSVVVEEGPLLVQPQPRMSEPDLIVVPEPRPIESVDPAIMGESELVVVGGPHGVSLERKAPTRPVLSGGFGRPRKQ